VIVVAKSLEALGIACLLIGLLQGIQADDMWIELYLSIIGVLFFGGGWLIERVLARRGRTGNGTT